MSLRAKLIAAFAAVACCVALVGGIAVFEQFQSGRQFALQQATSAAELVAAAAQDIGDPGLERDEGPSDGDVSRLQEFVEDLDERRGFEVSLVGRDGMVLADAHDEHVGTRFDGDPGGEVGRTISDGRSRSFQASAKHGEGGVTTQVVVPLTTDQGGIDGAVVLEHSLPFERAAAATRRAVIELSVASFLCLVLAVSLGVAFATRVRRRLEALATAADAIATGHFDQGLISPAGSSDEIGMLASSLASMAEQLRDRGEVEARLAAIVHSSKETIMAVSLDGTITAWNPAAEAMFGYAAEEMVGQPIGPISEGEDIEALMGRAAGGEQVDYEATRRRHDGSVFDASVSVSPIRHASGAVVGVSKVLRDITERKQAEAALAEARDEAVAASRTKSEFLATMSHEIRTPMNGVIGLTGLLLDTQLTETQRHQAEGVRSSGEALLGIINDILDFSKIEAGKLELETVDFDLSHAVEEVAALVSESARAKGLELVAYCRPEVPTALRGDVGRLRQILLNFATNAVKFTEAGEVVVRASLADEPTAEQVVVRLEVSDTGVGVDAATADRLFEPFSQADASTTRRYGGTGLGLAICRRLAEAMDGTIGVESQPGQGSTFWLCLPLERASAAIGEPDRSTQRLDARRVLVVDDNQTNRLVLASQLRAWGIATDLACDGVEALERLEEAADGDRPYDLALLDMCMAGMNGLQLAARVRADRRLASVRLLLLTSVAVEAEAVAEAGFAARLTKPVRLSTLYDALVRAVAPATETTAELWPAVAVGSRGTLLIVEDHAINQEVAKGIAAKLGYAADVAGDGAEALRALERRRYDGVLMDCHMPLMDGFQATAEIRRREAGRRHVPIIAMTAGALVEDREKCLAAGMDDYLAKPVKAHELELMLDTWLHGEASDQAVVDHDRLDMLRGLGPADGSVLARMVESFLAEAPANMAAIVNAVTDGDAAGLRECAHRLRGVADNLGASDLAALCSELEEFGRTGRIGEAPGLLGRLSVAMDSTAGSLHAAVAGGQR